MDKEKQVLVRSKWLPIAIFAAMVLLVAACTQATATTAPSADRAAPEPTAMAEQATGAMGTDEATGEVAEQTTTNEVQGTVWVANGMEDSLSAIDLATGKVVTTVPVGMNPHILNASPDGHILYVINAGQHDRQPGAHGESEGSEMNQETEHQSGMDNDGSMEQQTPAADHAGDMGMGMDVDQEAVANSLWAIDATTGQMLARVAVGQGPTHPIASPDGRWVYVTNTDEGSVSVIDANTRQVVTTIPNLPEPHDGELTPDGRLLYLATSGNSTMTVVDTTTRQVVQTFAVGKKPRGLAVGGPNGEIAYVTNKGDGTLSVIDVPAGQVKATLPVGKGAHAVRVSPSSPLRAGPDGKTVYVALSKEDAVAVVDAVSGHVLNKIPVGKTPEQIDLSPDGRWLFASNNGEATVSIINLSKGEVVATVPVGEGAYGVQAMLPVLSDVLSSSKGPFEGTTVEAHGKQMSAMPMFPRNADGYATSPSSNWRRCCPTRTSPW